MSSHSPPIAAPSARRDYSGIQYLRAVAASMIVIFHTGAQTSRAGFAANDYGWLTAGVDIFFVISGFIMWVTTASGNTTTVDFWRRRIRRIVPLYWLVTLVMICTLLIVPSAIKSGKLDYWHVISSLLFIPSVHPVTALMQPVVIPGWSLNYEMFFYVIFGGLLLCSAKLRLPLLILIFAALVMFGFAFKPAGVLAFYTSPIIAEFAAGALLGWLVLQNPSVSRFASTVLLLAGAASLPFSSHLAVLSLGPFTTLFSAVTLVAGVAFLDVSGAVGFYRLPHLLGDASYSTYITHGIVLSAFGQMWQRFHLFDLAFAVPIYTAVTVVVACLTGLFVHLFIEKPILGKRSMSLKVPSDTTTIVKI
jgi:exopolysaccharide production protein ExoZ